ncbi:hypothetical protein PVAG01_07649 [Phlyctema vagabunda]|uniref:Uncharacterized protein n=1 Tax=Phlyctema vagabunda TaxID=108571 RepID=A0ABR4PD16_9HELO
MAIGQKRKRQKFCEDSPTPSTAKSASSNSSLSPRIGSTDTANLDPKKSRPEKKGKTAILSKPDGKGKSEKGATNIITPKSAEDDTGIEETARKAGRPATNKAHVRKAQSHSQAARYAQKKRSRFCRRVAAFMVTPDPALSSDPASSVLHHRPGTCRPAWYRQNKLPEPETNGTKWQKLPSEILEMIFTQDVLLRTKGKTPNLLIALRPNERLYKIALPIYLRVNMFNTSIKMKNTILPPLKTRIEIRRLKIYVSAGVLIAPREFSPTTFPNLERLVLTSSSCPALLTLLHAFLHTAPFPNLKSLTIEILIDKPSHTSQVPSNLLTYTSTEQRLLQDRVLNKINKRLGDPTRFAKQCSSSRRQVWTWIAKDLDKGFELVPDNGGHIKF